MPEKRKIPVADYAKYSGMVFQLFLLLWMSYLAGRWIDKKLGLQKPVVTIIILLMAIFAYLYSIVKQTSKRK
jgi:membrane protein DedA with SNARE-associated domain